MNEEKTDIQPRLDEIFRWFHRHPELSHQETKTTARIKEILQSHGIELLDLPLETGAVAIIRGRKEHPLVGLRADIDALPIQETSGLSYASENPGVMHACGHDFHTTALLGAALLLKQQEKELDGSVKLLFQPAEESSGNGGAPRVIETHILDDVDVMYGLHVSPDLPSSTVGVRAGALNAAVDRFVHTVTGYGGHASAPHRTKDPVVAAAGLITALQTIVSRNIAPFEPAVVSVTHLETGSTWNVLPEKAVLEGTVRTFTKESRGFIRSRMAEITEGIARTYGVDIDLDYQEGAPAVVNRPDHVARVEKVVRGLGLDVVTVEPSMGGEDFSNYLEIIPGAFFHIGVGRSAPLHNSGFIADRGVLSTASRIFVAIVMDVLAGSPSGGNGTVLSGAGEGVQE